jgi:hypothetical protein
MSRQPVALGWGSYGAVGLCLRSHSSPGRYPGDAKRSQPGPVEVIGKLGALFATTPESLSDWLVPVVLCEVEPTEAAVGSPERTPAS